jgi:hypothetical protein
MITGVLIAVAGRRAEDWAALPKKDGWQRIGPPYQRKIEQNVG